MNTNRIGGVMVSVLASSVVDRWFELRLGETKDYKIGMCFFSVKHTEELRSKSKDWLFRNQDYQSRATCLHTVGCVSEQYKNPTKSVDLVQIGRYHHSIDI